MAAKWNEVEADKDYQALSDGEKAQVKDRYWNSVVSQDTEFTTLEQADQDALRQRFFGSAPSTPTTSSMGDVATQAVRTALPDTETFNQPIQGQTSGGLMQTPMAAFNAAIQTLRNPTRISPTVSAPGQAAGQAVEGAIGPSHPIIGKVANMATSVALDPQSYTGIPAEKLPEAAMSLAGKKVLAPLGEVLSATRVKDIARLFNNPREVLLAPSLKESGAMMGKVEKALNVTEDEMRLIEKAADRATGSSRSVVEGLIQKGKDLAVADAQEKLGRTLQPNEVLDVSKDWAKHLTPGELIAGRRGASKLTTVAKGRGSSQATKDLNSFEDAFVDKAKENALTYLKALKDQTNARTRDAFMNVIPRNKNMSSNALRGMAMVGEAFINPALAGLHAPIVTGAATLAAKGAYNAVASPVVARPALHAIRQYLTKQGR